MLKQMYHEFRDWLFSRPTDPAPTDFLVFQDSQQRLRDASYELNDRSKAVEKQSDEIGRMIDDILEERRRHEKRATTVKARKLAQ